MAAFVTHVPEQRAVRLAESMPAALSLDIVGLCDIHRDHAIAVPGQDARRLGVGWVRLEVERNSRPASATFLELQTSVRSRGTDVISSASGTYASVLPQFTHCEFSKTAAGYIGHSGRLS